MDEVSDIMKENFSLLIKFIELKNNKSDKKTTKIFNEFYNNLIERFSFIVDNHTFKYKKYSNYEDLCQEGKLGLSIAINKFNPERSKNFYKLANWYVKTHVTRAACKFSVISVPLKIKKSEYPKRVFDDNYFLLF